MIIILFIFSVSLDYAIELTHLRTIARNGLKSHYSDYVCS